MNSVKKSRNTVKWERLDNSLRKFEISEEYSAVVTGLEKVSFHPNPKERQAKECSNYCTIALISHASKVTSKFSKPGFNCT